MKPFKGTIATLFLSLLIPCVALSANGVLPNLTDTVLAHFSVTQCDSLIQANADNPDFVILDVRTLGEYNPTHLIGAIERDYWDGNFNTWINQLPRHKFYLVHCASGGRSGNTYNLMVGMNFTKVVNMLGGISAWNNASLPTTANFAPLHMAVSDTMVTMDTIGIGNVDTINLTVTNRANDTLRFTSITSLQGTEFTTDFDTAVTLLGPFDYTFPIYYTPIDVISDSISFLIESNGGDVTFHIKRTGKVVTGIKEIPKSGIKIYPNPADKVVHIDGNLNSKTIRYRIIDITGRVVIEKQVTAPVAIDVSPLENGTYILQLETATGTFSEHITVWR